MSAVVLLQYTLTCKITAVALCCQSMSSVSVLGRHGSVSLCRVERENKMAATYNVLAFKR